MIKAECKEHQEICFECNHIKRYHNSVTKGGSCSQPTCQCTCFIESGVYSGMDLFDAYEKGKQDTNKLQIKLNSPLKPEGVGGRQMSKPIQSNASELPSPSEDILCECGHEKEGEEE